jgi:hypothetical protein
MLAKFWLIAWLATSAPVLADTLASGAVYFDSQKTLQEVINLSAAKENESILKLITTGHVNQQTDSTNDIIILTIGLTPESPAEFRFLGEQTIYWTLTKFLTRETVVEPAPVPEQSPMPSATPEQAAAPREKLSAREPEIDEPFDNDNGRRIWHKVDGRWKWYPAPRKPGKKALPPDAPAKPSVTPQN